MRSFLALSHSLVPSMLQPSLSRRDAWIPLLAALAFLPALLGGFVYDDTRLITENVYVHDARYWPRAFTTHLWDVSSSSPEADTMRYYRPLVTLSYLANWLVSGERAWPFHLMNVLLHTLNTWLVLVVGRRFTGSQVLGAISALLFALHPTRAEAVIWVSGRPDPLMTCFVLLTVEFAYRGEAPEKRWSSILCVAVCFCAALLCKEPALATPILLGVGALQASSAARRWYLYVIGTVAAFSVGYVVLRRTFLPVETPAWDFTPAHALVTLTHYFERIVLPWPFTFFHRPQEWGALGPVYSPVDLGVGALLVGGAALLGAWALRRDRVALMLLIASAAFLGPLLNVTDTGSKFTTADRFLYLPLWLLGAGLARLARATIEHLFPQVSFRLAVGGISAIYVALIATRALDFTSDFALWNGELLVNPDNPEALRSRASAWTARNDRERAIDDLERSLRTPSLRFRAIASGERNVEAYGRLISLKARTLPDGARLQLEHLAQDALDRLAGRPRIARNPELAIEWPLDERSAHWVAMKGEAALARHLAPLTTRLAVHDISVSLLDAISDHHLHLAPNPLLIAIGEAREERFDRARKRHAAMVRRQHIMPSIVTLAALAELDTRLQSAEQEFARASRAADSERHLARAQAYASLGAYGRALLEVQHVRVDHPGRAPLAVQLLVFSRLDGAALEVASRALGPERGRTAVDAIRRQLPPELLALEPVSLTPGTK